MPRMDLGAGMVDLVFGRVDLVIWYLFFGRLFYASLGTTLSCYLTKLSPLPPLNLKALLEFFRIWNGHMYRQHQFRLCHCFPAFAFCNTGNFQIGIFWNLHPATERNTVSHSYSSQSVLILCCPLFVSA